MRKFVHGSLFSGIGGFDLAAEWMGWDNAFHCEWNPFGQRILKYYWPNATSYDDITKTDFTIWRGRIDVLSGGFPCQPYSVAGKRKGKADDRHLWPEMLRAIREIAPRWVVGENVRGLVNWNGGLVFDEVQADLEAIGYEVLPFILPACAVNAPHRRDRVWFVAYADKCNDRRASGQNENQSREERIQKRNETREFIESGKIFGATTIKNTRSNGCGNGEHDEQIGIGNLGQLGAGGKERVFAEANGENDAANANSERFNDGSDNRKKRHFQANERITEENKSERDGWKCRFRSVSSDATNPDSGKRCEGRLYQHGSQSSERHFSPRDARSYERGNWQNFPTVAPIRNVNDGISGDVARYITKDLENEISKTSESNRIKNLPKVWGFVQQEKIWQSIRGLYSLESKEILLEAMQLYSTERRKQRELSPFSTNVSEKMLQELQKYGEFRCSPQGSKLEKQRSDEFGDSLSLLPHEVALAARRLETSVAKFEAWHRNESIKAGGNAIVPQVAHNIFKAIMETQNKILIKNG